MSVLEERRLGKCVQRKHHTGAGGCLQQSKNQTKYGQAFYKDDNTLYHIVWSQKVIKLCFFFFICPRSELASEPSNQRKEN